MASGFYVNPEHLDHFERQVDRQVDYVDRAMDLMDLVRMKDELGRSGGVAGVSAYGWVVPSIEKWLNRAAHDNGAVKQALATSRSSLAFSLRYYKELDHSRAAELDRLYDANTVGNNFGTSGPANPASGFSLPPPRPIKPDEVPGYRPPDEVGSHPGQYTMLDHHWVDLYPLRTLDPNTNPSTVFGQNWVLLAEQTARDVEGKIPGPAGPIGFVMKALFGPDVIEKLSGWITGDWLAVEKVARALHWHGQVQRDVHDNLMRGLFAMQGMWTGGAGSHMQAAMQRLVMRGIAPHAQFLWEIRDRILNYAKGTYYAFRDISAFIDFVVSQLEPTAIGKKYKEIVDSLSPGTLGKLYERWGELTSTTEDLRVAALTVGAASAYASALSGSPTSAEIPDGFYHPADANRDGRVNAGERKGPS